MKTLTTALFTALTAGMAWLLTEAWEKINLVGMAKHLMGLGRKYGVRFFVAALVWELIEDLLFPYIAIKAGYPAIAAFFLVMHFEFVVYPLFFAAFRAYDRKMLSARSSEALAE